MKCKTTIPFAQVKMILNHRPIYILLASEIAILADETHVRHMPNVLGNPRHYPGTSPLKSIVLLRNQFAFVIDLEGRYLHFSQTEVKYFQRLRKFRNLCRKVIRGAKQCRKAR